MQKRIAIKCVYFIDINVFYFISESFLLLVSKNLATCSYVFPNSHEKAIRLTIPRIIVTADIPASLGP